MSTFNFILKKLLLSEKKSKNYFIFQKKLRDKPNAIGDIENKNNFYMVQVSLRKNNCEFGKKKK